MPCSIVVRAVLSKTGVRKLEAESLWKRTDAYDELQGFKKSLYGLFRSLELVLRI
jgi:hypothetical protein